MANAYQFKLAFRGENMGHSANAEDVGRSIMAFARVVDEVSRIQLPGELQEHLILEVKGFEQGSLETLFQMIVNPPALGMVTTALPLLQNAPSPKDILDFIKNTWEYFLFLKGHPARSKKDIGNDMIEVTNQDMETKTFFQPIVQARDNAHVYIGTQEIFQALHHEKIDEMVILEKDGGVYKKTFSIDDEQVEFLEISEIPEDDIDSIHTSTELVRILNMAVENDGKWRLKAMDTVFFSKIEDEEFLSRIKNEKLSNLVFLMVELETVSSKTRKRPIRTVKKVIQFFGNPEQTSIEAL